MCVCGKSIENVQIVVRVWTFKEIDPKLTEISRFQTRRILQNFKHWHVTPTYYIFLEKKFFALIVKDDLEVRNGFPKKKTNFFFISAENTLFLKIFPSCEWGQMILPKQGTTHHEAPIHNTNIYIQYRSTTMGMGKIFYFLKGMGDEEGSGGGI